MRLTVTACVVAVASACGGERQAPVETESRAAVAPFDGSAASMDELGASVMRSLVTGDVASLERFRLTEYEHNEVVWPELPASAPEANFPVDYAWTNIENRNRRALSRIATDYRDSSIGFHAVECRGGTRAFETFVVHTDCWVLFATERSSVEVWEVQLFKDVLERGSGYKIFRYYDEEPRLRSAT